MARLAGILAVASCVLLAAAADLSPSALAVPSQERQPRLVMFETFQRPG
jgi:hypothetical protein